MFKKSAIFITSLMLGFSITQGEDEVKKTVKEEVKKPDTTAKAGKYSIPEKKIEEFSKEELMSAVSYLQGIMVATQLANEKDIDVKVFLQSIEQKIKNPNLTADPAEWQKLIDQYQEVKKAKGEISAELKTSLSKNHGINFATKFSQGGFNLVIFFDAFNEKLANKDLAVPEPRIKEIGEKYQGIMNEEAKIAGEKGKLAGKTFLEENKKKEGVKTLPSGLQYKVIKEGKGATGVDGQTLKMHYVGTTIEGKEFDSSVKRNQTFDVVLPGQVIKGWQEILKLMPKGSKWQVFIPEDLAYGAQSPSPDIKPFSTLIFDMEVVDIVADVVAPPKKAD